MSNIDIDLLSIEDLSGKNKLDSIKKYGSKSYATDLAIITGGFIHGFDLESYGCVYLKSEYLNRTAIIDCDGSIKNCSFYSGMSIRPILKVTLEDLYVLINKQNFFGKDYVEYGSYPQFVPPENIQEILEKKYNNNDLQITGRTFTFNKGRDFIDEHDFVSRVCREYEFLGRKYIRIYTSFDSSIIDHDYWTRSKLYGKVKLSNNVICNEFDIIWVEVSPIKWIIDERAKLLIAKYALLSGIRFDDKNDYDGVFEKTEMYQFLHKYMIKDILYDVNLNFKLDKIDNEFHILEGMIGDIAVEDREAYLKALNDLKSELSIGHKKL